MRPTTPQRRHHREARHAGAWSACVFSTACARAACSRDCERRNRRWGRGQSEPQRDDVSLASDCRQARGAHLAERAAPRVSWRLVEASHPSGLRSQSKSPWASTLRVVLFGFTAHTPGETAGIWSSSQLQRLAHRRLSKNGSRHTHGFQTSSRRASASTTCTSCRLATCCTPRVAQRLEGARLALSSTPLSLCSTQ